NRMNARLAEIVLKKSFDWLVELGRSLLSDLEHEIEATTCNEIESLMSEFVLNSQTLTYFASAGCFSHGDGSNPKVFASSDVCQRSPTLCPAKWRLTSSEKREEVPLLGMDRNRKFHSISKDSGKAEVLSDRAFGIICLPLLHHDGDGLMTNDEGS
ncbi:MAG: hypothetical protein AAF665_14555, partial [Pseudomonadota bacterium]